MFALAVADRDEVLDTDTAGYCLTTVPFPPGSAGRQSTPSPENALRRAREFIADAQSMSRVPFPKLMVELGLRDAQSLAPLVIAWDRDAISELSIPGYTAQAIPVNPLGVRWPWTVLLTDCGDLGMSGRIEYPPGVPAGQVTRFGERLESMLIEFISSV